MCYPVDSLTVKNVLSGIDSEGGYACVGAGGIWEISAPSIKFCYAPKLL